MVASLATAAALQLQPLDMTTRSVPRRIAVAYHGHFRREFVDKYLIEKLQAAGTAVTEPVFSCSDWEQSASSREAMLFAPLRSAGAQLSFYLHTFLPERYQDADDAEPETYGDLNRRASCPALERLITRIAPRRHLIEQRNATQGPSSAFARVLELVQRDASQLDAVLLLRFDVGYHLPLEQLGLKWDQMNMAFRNEENLWASNRRTSDLFFAMPILMVEPMLRALHAFEEATGSVEGIHDKLLGFPAVRRAGVHFVDDRFCSSTQSKLARRLLRSSSGPSSDLRRGGWPPTPAALDEAAKLTEGSAAVAYGGSAYETKGAGGAYSA